MAHQGEEHEAGYALEMVEGHGGGERARPGMADHDRPIDAEPV
jgi:hypothetical protein